MISTQQKFIKENYSETVLNTFLIQYREKGFVVLPNVFERKSVKKFKKELEKIIYNNSKAYIIPNDSPQYIAAVLTSRDRQFLPFALSHSVAKPMPALHTSIFVIETDEMRGQYAPDWHKDRVLVGGSFAPPTKETIKAFSEEYENSEVLHRMTFPKQK